MRWRLLFVLLLTLAAGVRAAAPAVNIRLGDGNILLVQYRFPPGERLLRFVQQDEQLWTQLRQPHWKVQEGCAELRPEGIARRDTAACGTVTVQVTPGLLRLDRRFEPAQLLGEGAIALYTRYYAVRGEQGGAVWRIDPPPGGSAWWLGREQPAAQEVLLTDDDNLLEPRLDRTTVLLSRRPLESWRGVRVLAAGLSEPLQRELRLAAESLLAEYRHSFGPLSYKPLLLVLGVAAPAQQVARARGETLDGVVRMTVDYGGGALSDKDRGALRVFLAHELFHLWQGRRFYAASEAWLGEGNADWIALNTLHRLGWMNDSVYVLLLEQAFNECAVGIGAQPWRMAPQRQGGTLPYRCGLAFHAMAFEAARREGNNTGPLEQWRAILGAAPLLREADFFDWYGRPDFGGTRLAALRALLDGDAAFAPRLPATMRAAGVSFELAPTLSWLAKGCGSKAAADDVHCPDAPSVPGGFIHLGVIGSAKGRVEIRQ